MANTLIRDIKSINTAIVKTTSIGSHVVGYVFGSKVTITSSANASIINGTGSTADVSEPWTIELLVPEHFKFSTLLSVETVAGGAVTLAHYSASLNSDGNMVITFIAGAEDTGGAIANGEEVTITWRAFDYSTLHATIFGVKCQSDSAGHTATIKARFTEGGTLHTFTLFAGDSLIGPFSELEVDALSNASASCIVFYQEH